MENNEKAENNSKSISPQWFYYQTCKTYLSAIKKQHPNEGFSMSEYGATKLIEFKNSDCTIFCETSWEIMLEAIVAFYIGTQYRFKD